MTVLVVDNEDEGIEVYAAVEEKDDAYAALTAIGSDQSFSGECRIAYSADLEACPVCGAKNDRSANEDHSFHDQEGM